MGTVIVKVNIVEGEYAGQKISAFHLIEPAFSKTEIKCFGAIKMIAPAGKDGDNRKIGDTKKSKKNLL